MKALITILCLATVIYLLMLGMVSEVDMREQKLKNRRAYNAWLTERALNEHVTAREWTR